MKKHLLLTSSLALSAGLAGTAMADVTASDVWANQQAYLGALGMQASGTLEGDTLSGVQINATLPMGIASFRIDGPDVVFADNGDGTVTISYPSPAEIMISGNIQDVGPFDVTLQMTHGGYDIVASGTPGDVTYTMEADSLRLELREANFPEGEGFDIAATVEMDNWTATNRITEGNLINIESSSEIGTTVTKLIMTEPTGMVTTTDQTTLPMTSTVSASLPVGGSDLLNLSQAIRNGLSLSVDSAGEGNKSETIVVMGGEPFSNQTSATGAQTSRVSLTENGLTLSGEASGFAMTMEQPFMMPVPVEFGIADMAVDYDLPLNASEEVQDFKMLMNLNGISISDSLWGMFDPAGQLPREEAHIEMDISGEGTMGIDLLDVMTLMTMQAPPPIEVNSVNVDNLRIAAVGAEAQAEGAFTFDWTDFSTIPGIARPEGSLEINVVGANALMDTLSSMGLLTEQDTMGARMMMGIFAEPIGDDILRSVIEVNDQGHVLANGQRLQ